MSQADADEAGRARARDYDTLARRSLAGYEALHQLACAALSAKLPAQAKVLIVGSGTGHELLTLGTVQRGWTFEAIDPDRHAEDVAREKIAYADAAGAMLAERVSYFSRLGDLPPSPAADAGTALLVTTFLDDGDDSKLHLLEETRARLKSGAPFLLADYVGAREAPEFSELVDVWKERFRQQQGDPAAVHAALGAFHLVDEQRYSALVSQAGFERPRRFFASALVNGWLTTAR